MTDVIPGASNPLSTVGTSRSSASPCPSCPSSPLPHEHSALSVRSATEWLAPAETSTTAGVGASGAAMTASISSDRAATRHPPSPPATTYPVRSAARRQAAKRGGGGAPKRSGAAGRGGMDDAGFKRQGTGTAGGRDGMGDLPY
uniref:Uncharacterized protein n=1 Tax=Arundo donax TaxID=35708 RepID=A0A0A9H492_ARUDO